MTDGAGPAVESRAQDPAPPAGDARPFLTVEDLAAVLGLTPRGARLVLERGELPGFRLGRRWYVRRVDLDQAIAEKVAGHRQDRDAAARMLRGLPARKTPRKP